VLEQWEGDLVQRVVNELIDGFAGAGKADLVQELTFNFPVQVIAQILGLPRSDFPMFQRWAIDITSVASNWDRGVAASAALRDYFADVLAERRRQPADDLISELAVCEVDGRRLGDEEIYSFLRLLLPAGVETTYRASGNVLYGLLTNPDQLHKVMADRSLIPDAFEESIRWEPPVTIILRRAMRDTELAGVPITEGADVALLLGAGQSRRAEVRAPRAVRSVPGLAPERWLRIRCPRLPRHAPGPYGDTGGSQHPLRPTPRHAALDADDPARICTSRVWPSVHPLLCRSPSVPPDPFAVGRRCPVCRADGVVRVTRCPCG
jgi:hypothetical protein